MNNVNIQDSINKALWATSDIFRKAKIKADVYKDYILTMFFLKYISDVYKEHRTRNFGLPLGFSFYHLYEKRHKPGNGERIDRTLQAIEEANAHIFKNADRSVFQDISFSSTKLGREKQKNTLLCSLMEEFAEPELNLDFSWIDSSDIIGNAYEYMIKKIAIDGDKESSKLYIPSEVSDLLVELLAPKPGDSICDPACGLGFLPIKCAHKIKELYHSKNYTLYGQEATGPNWSLAKINMFLQGEEKYRLEWGDTIRNPKLLDNNGKLQLFDVVTSNLLFPVEKWGQESAKNDRFDRFLRGIPPKTYGEYAYILHMIETLKPDTGRLGVIVPHGVLFREGERIIRKMLVNENLLQAVIGLPEKLFYGTNNPAAILVFHQNKKDKNVLFIDASREFEPGKRLNRLSKDNIQKIIQTFRDRCNKDKYSYLASFEEIRDNNFNLHIPRYVETYEEKKISQMDVLAKHRKLNAELYELGQEMEKMFEENEDIKRLISQLGTSNQN